MLGVPVILAESLWKIGSFRRSLTSGNFPKWVLTVSFLPWRAAFTRMWKRADSHTRREYTHALTHTGRRTEKRGYAEGSMTYFPPFRLREFNTLSAPHLGTDPRENDFIIHEMQNALGSLEKYRAISRKSKSRYRVLVLNATCLRFTHGCSVLVKFTVPKVCARRKRSTFTFRSHAFGINRREYRYGINSREKFQISVI